MNERVLCIAPAWNEESRIAKVVREMPADVTQFVVVDDGSTDATAANARAAGATVIVHEQNRGVGAAIRTGMLYGLEHGFDVIVVVSGGGKTPPRQIPRLLEPILDDRADFVQGSRYLEGGEYLRMPLQRRIGTRVYTLLFSLFVGRRVTDGTSGFRAVRASLLRDPRIQFQQAWLDRYELEPYLLFKALRLGHRVVEIPVTIEYPADRLAYTKVRAVIDWWVIFRPVLFLALGIRR